VLVLTIEWSYYVHGTNAIIPPYSFLQMAVSYTYLTFIENLCWKKMTFSTSCEIWRVFCGWYPCSRVAIDAIPWRELLAAMITGTCHRHVKSSLPVSIQHQSSWKFSLRLWQSFTALYPEHRPLLALAVRFLQSLATRI